MSNVSEIDDGPKVLQPKPKSRDAADNAIVQEREGDGAASPSPNPMASRQQTNGRFTTWNGDELHQLMVGDRAHRIVGAFLRQDVVDDRPTRAIALTRCAHSVFDEHPVEYRTREAFVDAVTAAGVYLQRFRPLPPWQLVADEMPSGPCRFDLVYELDECGILIDELKLGIGRRGESEVRKQIDAYLDEGLRRWHGRFLGVRLCAVHEPTRSRLYVPDRKYSLPVTARDISAELSVR